MTDRSSIGTSQPSPDAVRRSLRALADGSAPGRRHAQVESESADTASSRSAALTGSPSPPASTDTASALPPESLVRDAERAVEDAPAAAAFLAAERLPHLDAAITTAAARGNDELAERGRAAKRSLRRLAAVLER